MNLSAPEKSRGDDGRQHDNLAFPQPPLSMLPVPPQPQQSTLPSRRPRQNSPLPLPRAMPITNDDSMRLPGSGDLMDAKNTLQSNYSTVELVSTSSSLNAHASTGSDSYVDGPVETGFYKQMNGTVGSNSAHTPNGRESGQHYAVTTGPRGSGGGAGSTSVLSGSTTPTNGVQDDQGSRTRVEFDQGNTPVLVHGYHAPETTDLLDHRQHGRYTSIQRGWIWTLCTAAAVLFPVVAIVIATVLYVSVVHKLGRVAPTTSQTNNDARATQITTFINSIKLSTGNLTVPVMPTVSVVVANVPVLAAKTSEQAALTWLVNNDPLQLSPDTNVNKFRLQQRYALLTLLLQYKDLSTSDTLTSTGSECDWQYVTNCSTTATTEEPQSWAFVTHIVARGKFAKLGSTLSPDLGLLTNLVHINVASTGLVGRLPVEWVNTWSNLQFFDVSHNDLAGSLPLTLGAAWTNLHYFGVGNNALTGSLAASLGSSWTSLKVFMASNNALTGMLPSSLGSAWTNLERFSVPRNDLQGSLPSLLGTTWTCLTFFDVGGNDLTGSLPALLGMAWTNLSYFYVHANALTGRIPSSANHWKHVKKANFQNNSLVGSMPSDFCRVMATSTGEVFADCDKVACSCCRC